jgi:predicted nucleic acid-binding protein
VVVLDTNVIIDYIRQPASADSHLVKFIQSNPTQDLAVSIITVQELYVGQSSKSLMEEQLFLKIIEPFKIVPYEFETAKLAGKIMRDSKIPVFFADAAIAATTILNKAKLFTLNKKDFQGAKELKLI